MDRYSVFVPRLLPDAEPFVSEARSCPGCGQAMAVRVIAKAIAHARRYPFGGTAVGTVPGELPSCGWRLFDGKKFAADGVPDKLEGIIAFAGESQSLEHGLELLADKDSRATRLYICLFNESGIERHGAPAGAGFAPDRTAGILQRFEHMRACIARARAARPDFLATACSSFPFDLTEKVCSALSCGGSGFIAVLAPCPTGCLYDPAQSLESGRLAVETGLFPLYRIEQGRCSITVTAPAAVPVSRYVELQPLVPGLSTPELEQVQALADKNLNEFARLKKEKQLTRGTSGGSRRKKEH